MVVSSAGFESVQGRRTTMEDAHVLLEDVNESFNLHASVRRAYYGVYDGHGGTNAAGIHPTTFSPFYVHLTSRHLYTPHLVHVHMGIIRTVNEMLCQ